MTNNEGASGSGDESSAENKVPSQQEGEGDDQAVNAPVPPHASLPRRRQEELLPRQRPSLVHVQLGALRPRGATMPTPRPPPPPTPRAPQHPGGASDSGGKAGSAFRGVPIVIGGGIQVGGGAEGALGVVGIPSEAPRPHKRKSDVVAPVGLQPICRVCSRDFLSWKALFGHLRSHPDRDWRGCFPPPVEGQDFPPPPPPLPLPLPAHPPIGIVYITYTLTNTYCSNFFITNICSRCLICYSYCANIYTE